MATQDSNPFGSATGSGGGMFGGGMWGGGGGMSYGMPPQQGYGGFGGGYGGFGGGYGGYGGMQSPYGGGYGGFGGGMPYGGGYGMQSPYGAPGGYGGGYGMQSPYGGYAPQGYGMPSQYGPQPSYGMPQQQTMAAPQTLAATDTAAANATDDAVAPADDPGPTPPVTPGGGGKYDISTAPWKPQGTALARLWQGSGTGVFQGRDPNITGAYMELERQQGLGPLGFDPSSEAALQRMQALAGGPNPLVDTATGASQDVASGRANIGTGGMFQSLYGNPGIQTGGRFASLYDQPGIQNLGQYQDMYSNPNIGGIDQYGRMAGQNAVGNADQYGQMIGQNAVGNQSQYENAVRNPIDTGMADYLYYNPSINNSDRYGMMYAQGGGVDTNLMRDIYGGAGGPGSLTGGAFGQVARGNLINGNPYREQAIQQAMGDTADQVKATMSSRGRYGSDAYGDAMGTALGKVATQARMAGYDTDTANMMTAAQARSGEDLARQGVGLQAAQGVMSGQGQNWQNQLAALTGQTGAQNMIMQNKLAAARDVSGINQQNVANQLSAAQGVSGLQGTNAAQRLAQIQGLSGIQGQNYQGQLSALGGMNAAQQLQNQQRMAAAQGLTSGQGQNWQNQLGAANALTGVQGQNWQNQLGAANALTGVNSQDIQNRLAAAGMAPAMQGLRYDDAGRLLQAGATREQMAQSQRNYGWNQLGQFSSLIGNVPGTAGTQQKPDKPWWETALGAASTVGGIWGQMK